jgi:hypothetical protein
MTNAILQLLHHFGIFAYPNRAEMKKLCLFYGVPTTPYLFVDDYESLKKYR